MSKRPDYRWSVITIIWLSSVISIWTLFSGAATAQRAVPSIRDIVAFEVDPVQPRQRPGVSDFDVSLDDLEQVLTTYQVVTEARWRADYHHVAFTDRTGTLSLRDGTTVTWLVWSGGWLKIERCAADGQEHACPRRRRTGWRRSIRHARRVFCPGGGPI